MANYRKTIIIDVETGGLDPSKDSLLEVCIKELNGKVLLNTLVSNTEQLNINPSALDINQLDEENIKKNGISDFDCYNKIRNILINLNQEDENTKKSLNLSPDFAISGKNVIFDINFIKELFKRHNDELDNYIERYRFLEIDTLLLSHEIRNNMTFPNLSLENVCNHFKIDFIPHRAYNDVIASEKLLNKLINNKRTLQEILFKVYSINPQLIFFNVDFHRECEKEAGHKINFIQFMDAKQTYLGSKKEK